jgi:2',3'-cyclic-nucleotide 2'-phosphodiesterase (5'-nucleotidase family)
MVKTVNHLTGLVLKMTYAVVFIILVTLLMNCSNTRKAAGKKEDGRIKVTLLQLNDIYEISPLEEGRSGGIARVAAFRESLQKENPATYTMLAGDFLSPSAMGAIRMENGKRIDGLQMIGSLNAAGIDLVTFGNHEFDLGETQLIERINLSKFDWVSSNVKHRDSSFSKTENGIAKQIPSAVIRNFTDGDGTILKIGFFGLTINSTLRDYVQYADYLQGAGDALKELNGKCDFVVALTHLPFRDDSVLAVKYPFIKLIVGGHEHENSYTTIGHTIIAKADANVKTVYVHSLNYNVRTKELNISSTLVKVDESIKDDPATSDTVRKWNELAYSLLKKKFDPCEVIATLPGSFDGTEHSIRSRSTNLTQLIAEAIYKAPATKPDCAIFNSGAVRIDDYLKGNVTNYDIFRVLPFGGKIYVAKIKGSVLKTILNISDTSQGNGCFLQDTGITRLNSVWMINNKPIDDELLYSVATNDFLISGGQERMTFLKEAIGDKVDSLASLPGAGLNDSNDWQQAVANYMKKKYPPVMTAPVKKYSSLPCY